MTRLIITFIVFSVVIAIPPLALTYSGHTGWLAGGFWKMFIFFFVITLVVCGTVLIGQRIDSKMGVQFFMGATILKLLMCMTYALFYVYKVHLKAPVFIASFFYLYLLNTAFELYALLSNLRDQNKK